MHSTFTGDGFSEIVSLTQFAHRLFNIKMLSVISIKFNMISGRWVINWGHSGQIPPTHMFHLVFENFWVKFFFQLEDFIQSMWKNGNILHKIWISLSLNKNRILSKSEPLYPMAVVLKVQWFSKYSGYISLTQKCKFTALADLLGEELWGSAQQPVS